ncbi:MAG: hypothetical protein H6712_19930 [Myxococcales bacterium]|nr:hypothetical protein [Myxococcales bacterium]
MPLVPVLLLALAASPEADQHRLDAPLPPRPSALTSDTPTAARELGTPTTLFVNFDGVELGSCTPSNSKRNCHWYNTEKPFPPFSGTTQTKVSVLQAMRRDAADYGIRITGQRPPDSEDYTMVIYGGTEAEYGALGSAPPGDCLDQLPNQIAFAHVDGELNDWINGGATTALHEAAHSWGLDHIETEHAIMFPTGNNEPTAFLGECSRVVEDVALTPGEASCPDLNTELCGDPNAQQARATLEHLFGGPYVDVTPPTIELSEPHDGQYFQAPAEFEVVLDIRDDLHPQVYDAAFWLGDDPKPESKPFVEDHFSVTQLPIGTWEFHVEMVDEAGHSARLDFTIEVGEDPPPEPESEGGCAVGAGRARGVSGLGSLVVLLLGLVARRRRPR